MRTLVPIPVLLLGCTEYDYSELRQEDRFHQEDVSVSSDVLFVVDDSASMAEEQARLAENFSAFLAVVQETYADYQLGVVTTDVEADGAGILRGGVLSPDTPELAAAFSAAIDVGTRGSRVEQGLAAAVTASNHPANEGFLRPEATFHVVIFSDEDDHSPHDVEVYLDGLSGAATVHAVAGDLPHGCASGPTAADPALRYLDAVSRTDGFHESICADDYSELLTRVGLDVAGLRDTFYLSEVPDPETIAVEVDGVAIHQREVDGWRYAPGENAIVFDGRAVPRPGMLVTAEYALLLGDDPGA